jgi:Fusaric acid resistance protein family
VSDVLATRRGSFFTKDHAGLRAGTFSGIKLQLDSPQRAAVAVWIVAQPKPSQVWGKGFYRLVGTFVGGAVSIVLMGVVKLPPAEAIGGRSRRLDVCSFVVASKSVSLPHPRSPLLCDLSLFTLFHKSPLADPTLTSLFNSYTLGQVARFIDIATQLDGKMVGKELQRYHGQNRSHEIGALGDKNDVIGKLGNCLLAFRRDGYHPTSTRLNLFKRIQILVVDRIVRSDHDRGNVRPDQSDDSMLQFGTGVPFSKLIGDLL